MARKPTPQTPLNIWNNCERLWAMRLDFVFEGQTMAGIHHSDFDDVVNDLDWLIGKISKYRDEMAWRYEHEVKKYNPSGLTYIYLARDNSNGYIKIGRSVDPQKREKTLISDKSTIELIFISPLCDKRIEKELHRQYAHSRVRGEWFDLTDNEVNSIKNKSQWLYKTNHTSHSM